MRAILVALAFVAANVSCEAHAAGGVPRFDIVRQCKGETADASGIGESLASCINDEEQAKTSLARDWDRFASEDRTTCIRATSLDGTPSYVELQTCLEMADYNRARLNGLPK
jgi:hypothetical protein